VLKYLRSFFTPSSPQKLEETSDKDLSATATSKKGGNENPKTTGKTGGNFDAGAFLDNAPGGEKNGNNFKSASDKLTSLGDLNTILGLFNDVRDKTEEVINTTIYKYTVADPLGPNGSYAPAQVVVSKKDTVINSSDTEKVKEMVAKNKKIANEEAKEKINRVASINIILLLMIVSCNNNSGIKKSKDNRHFVNDVVEFEFDFPDTVYINKSYSGKIKYKGILDTLTTSFEESKNGTSRYIIYSLTKNQNINYKEDQLRKMPLDTFGATDNRTIPFYNVKFTKLGINYIDGFINDFAIIDTVVNKKADSKARYIENEVRATHRVIVVEESNPIH